MIASRLMRTVLVGLLLGGCGEPERPRLRITLGQSACKPSCAAPQYEFMVLRSTDGGNTCALAARTANAGGGSVVLEGVEVGPGEQVTVAVRVVCPVPPGGCPHECFAFERVTAADGAVPLNLVQSNLAFCFSDPIQQLPPSCSR